MPTSVPNFDNPIVRAAFRIGARTMLDSMIAHLRPSEERAARAWLAELDGWTSGPPPVVPAVRAPVRGKLVTLPFDGGGEAETGGFDRLEPDRDGPEQSTPAG